MAVMPEINRINRNLATFANGRTIRYVDINDKLADADGRLFDGMMNSGTSSTQRSGLSAVGRRAETGFCRAARGARGDQSGAAADGRSERARTIRPLTD